jgi:prepilin-type N-terminal cleavage/methylation domain-containing protein
MYQTHKGFTLVELLVTLVLMALISSVVVPQIGSWLASRERATIKAEVSNKLALLPLQASRSERGFTITDFSQLDLSYDSLNVIDPITVLPSGFCIGGRFEFSSPNVVIEYNVESPLCKVTEI